MRSIVQFHAEVSTMPPIRTMTKATGSEATPTTCDRTRKMRSAMKAESMNTSPWAKLIMPMMP